MNNSNPDFDSIRRKAEEANKTPVYIALFGQPGAGKSSLINAIVGQAIAKVGVENDVTFERTDYEWNGLVLSDLPGYGTEKFPAETYFKRFEIEKFDIFICVASGKLKDDDISFFRALVHAGKRCIFVRNKIDAEFEPGTTDIEMRARIASDLHKQIGGEERLIFTSCRTMQGLDDLMTTIMNALSGVKRDRFLRSAAVYSREFLEKKRDVCRNYAWYAAGVSAVGNMIPIPGVGVTVDISAVLAAMTQIRSDFNLTSARMDKFAGLMPGVAPLINTVIGYATREGAVLLLKRVATSAAVAEAAKYVPVFGTFMAGAVSFAAIRIVLEMYIDDCYKISDEMLKSQFQI